ncbi:MAG: LLM class F420-dependent oxidoreductase [Actinomycetota bacterium]|jgi:F420-dependent oxidoreductase-like protein|nr:LLM class F420-dependent oxidoreductase [Actinomycetota bacterium]MDA3015827.1 LLM class F420-dependent oxidoreductase [Actinomycetota bacterium]MDA3027154.1 LLM class F420-dependent oxidoreductase [Actinomycetota bacterium]
MTRLGYQIPSFTYPGVGPDRLFNEVARQAREAEAGGFDTVMVMDHFYQLPMIGPPEMNMLECYTVLAALARETSTVRLSSLVTGNTYRNPAVLAKIITTLDIVSGGRAQLGIGAGWFELEHSAFGIEFGTFTDRFEKLDEALQIIIPMLSGERPSLDGKWYSVHEAMNEPPPVGRIPVMIGGGGERKTLRFVARYADDSNLICPVSDISRKLAVLDEHCGTEKRDRASITVTRQQSVCIAPTHDEAVAELDAMLMGRGLTGSDLELGRANVVHGSPDEVAEQMATQIAMGLDGFTVNAVANCHIPGRVQLLGETLTPLIAG